MGGCDETTNICDKCSMLRLTKFVIAVFDSYNFSDIYRIVYTADFVMACMHSTVHVGMCLTYRCCGRIFDRVPF